MSSINEDSVYAIERHALHPSESRLCGVDFTGELLDGEELTGTPTVSIEPSSGVSLSELAVNTAAAVNGQGQPVAPFKSALFRLAGLSAPQDYTLTVTCDTTGGNRLTVQCLAIGQK